MTPDFRWITPLYGFNASCRHIAVSEKGRKALREMAQDVAGTQGLVAIYIPEGTEAGYNFDDKKGRVCGAVSLSSMPKGKRVEDYYYKDLLGELRWPIGCPCETIYAPDADDCPHLRDLITQLYGSGSFGPYVSRMQHGPFELEAEVRERLNSGFRGFTQILSSKM